jgi:hypothetical protein
MIASDAVTSTAVDAMTALSFLSRSRSSLTGFVLLAIAACGGHSSSISASSDSGSAVSSGAGSGSSSGVPSGASSGSVSAGANSGSGLVTTGGSGAGMNSTGLASGASAGSGSGGASGRGSDAGAGTAGGTDASDAAGSCLGSSFLSALGKDRLIVGVSGSSAAEGAAPYDLRYVYLSGGLFSSSTPCTSCSSCGPSGSWWGCYNTPPGMYATYFLQGAAAATPPQIPMFTYYEILQTAKATIANLQEGTAEATQAATNTGIMTRYYNDWRFLLQTIGQKKALLHKPDAPYSAADGAFMLVPSLKRYVSGSQLTFSLS